MPPASSSRASNWPRRVISPLMYVAKQRFLSFTLGFVAIERFSY